MKKYLLLGILFVLLSAQVAYATIPKLISVQGRLTDSTGTAINEARDFKFEIVNSTSTVWGPEAHSNVQVANGIFNVTLGTISPSPITIPSDQDIYLRVYVKKTGEEYESFPLLQITSSGYAFWAKNAGWAASLECTNCVELGTETSGTLPISEGGTGATTESAARTNLGLGTISTQAASNVAITGGSITGITDLAIADGGTGASDASTARTNLGAAGTGSCTGSNVVQTTTTSGVTCVAVDTSITNEIQDVIFGKGLQRVSNNFGIINCAANQIVKYINNAWVCAADEIGEAGTGDITGVYAGTGLSGGGASGEVTLSLGSSYQDGSAYDSRFVNVGGDTMTGNLTFNAAGKGVFWIDDTTAYPHIDIDAATNGNLWLSRGSGTGAVIVEGPLGVQTGSSLDKNYALDVAGNVRWSGTLGGGTVPWARLSDIPNYVINTPADMTGFSPNSAKTITKTYPHATTWSMIISLEWADYGTAHVVGFENDNKLIVAWAASNGDGTMSFGEKEVYESSGSVLFGFGTGNYRVRVSASGTAGTHSLKIETNGWLYPRASITYGDNSGDGTGGISGSGSANKVAFWTDGSTLNYNTNFHWDNTNAWLGIGTTAPTAQLTVGVDDGTGTAGGAASIARLALAPPKHTGGDWVFTTRDNTPTSGKAYLDIGYGATGASALAIDSSGNVGIGTTGPDEKLTVAVSDNSDVGLRLERGAGYWDTEIKNSGGNLHFQLGADATSLDTKMIIQHDGNVGIGKTDPGADLHVSKTGQQVDIAINADAAQIAQVLWQTAGMNEWAIYRPASSNDLRIHESGVGDKVTFQAGGNVGIGDTGPDAKLDVLNTGTGASFRVDDSSDEDTTPFIIDADGKVGIGTAGPNSLLTLTGSTNGESVAFLDYTFFGSEYSSGHTMLGNMVRPRRGSGTYEKGTSITVASSMLELGNDISFATKVSDSDAAGTAWDLPGNTKMIILNSGSVGIGDTTPDAKLDVEGNARFDYSGGSTVINDYSGVSVNNAEGTTSEARLGAAWGMPGVYTSTNMYIGTGGTKIQFGTGGSEAAYIDTSGNMQMDGDLTVSGASTNFRNAIKAVDGSGSGIDADMVDGITPLLHFVGASSTCSSYSTWTSGNGPYSRISCTSTQAELGCSTGRVLAGGCYCSNSNIRTNTPTLSYDWGNVAPASGWICECTSSTFKTVAVICAY